eukprot:TRINITY_DN61026_c0_g1_i1.p1 TRINITY_DN61026_c0_g1~~TRINITY_DN61026_c0_g1_i1.p1  ORF type:complete len:456 (-),score=38.72 TRINITY_DN61026_c0_g1_i1:64-1431(-)
MSTDDEVLQCIANLSTYLQRKSVKRTEISLSPPTVTPAFVWNEQRHTTGPITQSKILAKTEGISSKQTKDIIRVRNEIQQTWLSDCQTKEHKKRMRYLHSDLAFYKSIARSICNSCRRNTHAMERHTRETQTKQAKEKYTKRLQLYQHDDTPTKTRRQLFSTPKKKNRKCTQPSHDTPVPNFVNRPPPVVADLDSSSSSSVHIPPEGHLGDESLGDDKMNNLNSILSSELSTDDIEKDPEERTDEEQSDNEKLVVSVDGVSLFEDISTPQQQHGQGGGDTPAEEQKPARKSGVTDRLYYNSIEHKKELLDKLDTQYYPPPKSKRLSTGQLASSVSRLHRGECSVVTQQKSIHKFTAVNRIQAMTKDPEQLLATPLQEWTVDDVCVWALHLPLSRDYTFLLKEKGVCGNTLDTMLSKGNTFSTWSCVGILHFGDIRLLQLASEGLKQEQGRASGLQ